MVLPEVASPIREVLRSQMDGHQAAVGYVPEPLPHPIISLGISFQTLRPTSDGFITMSSKVMFFIQGNDKQTRPNCLDTRQVSELIFDSDPGRRRRKKRKVFGEGKSFFVEEKKN